MFADPFFLLLFYDNHFIFQGELSGLACPDNEEFDRAKTKKLNVA
jgi:hypothetical protein